MCALARVARESIGVEKKKEFPDQRRSARRTFPHLGSPRSRPTLPLPFEIGREPADPTIGKRSATSRRTPTTNRSSGSIKTIIVGCVNEGYALVQL